MNKFFAIAGALLAAGTAAALAETQTGTLFGFPASAQVGAPYTPDRITWNGPKGTETIDVLCAGNGIYTWEAWGPNPVELIDIAAKEWCRDF